MRRGKPIYAGFRQVDAAQFLALLNRQKIRTHLVEHEAFTLSSVRQWMDRKQEIDAMPGCRIRALLINGQLVGWCGIQFESGHYELAAVIDDRYWGTGRQVFGDMMTWARQFGHTKVYLHLRKTRPGYKYLQRLSSRVFESILQGEAFISYEITLT